MAEKSPAFQFYPKDYLTDAKVVAMTPEIRGLYVQLLCHDWLEDGIYPDDICALSGFEWFREDGTLRDDWNTIEQVLNRCFIQHPTDDQKVTNPRLLRARQEQLENREKKRLAGIESGKARKSKELSLGTDVPLCSSRKGTQSSPSSSSSSSSSSNINIHTLPINELEEQEKQCVTEQNPYLIKANSKLLTPNLDKPESWQGDSRWVNAARRPLKKAPMVFLSVTELAEIYRQYEKAGLCENDIWEAVQSVCNKLITYQANGKGVISVSAANWICGWAKQEILENRIKETKLQKVKQPYQR